MDCARVGHSDKCEAEGSLIFVLAIDRSLRNRARAYWRMRQPIFSVFDMKRQKKNKGFIAKRHDSSNWQGTCF
jgi:hypothetical protein